MKTHLATGFGIALSVALGAAMGCGAEVYPQGNGEEAAVQSDALTTSSLDVPHYFTVKRDLRRCRYPRCGGWFVEEANLPGPAIHVARLDLSHAGLSADLEREVLSAPERDLVLRGSLGLPDRDGARTLVVAEAFQGMPGFVRAPEDGYYGVSCLVSSCEVAVAYRVDTAIHGEIDGVSIDRVLAPFVSRAWLVDRVEHHGAIVAGHLVSGGLDVTGAPGRVLEASQVFVGLSAASGPCLLIKRACPASLTATYTRDANLCLDLDGCVHPGVCPQWRPACAEGYTLTSWPAGDHACPAFACDPAFLAD